MYDVVPDARVAWTAINPDDRPMSFTIPYAIKLKDRRSGKWLISKVESDRKSKVS